MPTKHDLQTDTLLDRNMTRTTNPDTGRHAVIANAVDKTPLMLYTEGITGLRIEAILRKQMSARRLAEWLTHEIGKQVSYGTIIAWRKQYNITRSKR